MTVFLLMIGSSLSMQTTQLTLVSSEEGKSPDIETVHKIPIYGEDNDLVLNAERAKKKKKTNCGLQKEISATFST